MRHMFSFDYGNTEAVHSLLLTVRGGGGRGSIV